MNLINEKFTYLIRMNIRRCSPRDIEHVLEIEHESFSSPYSREIFEDYLSSDLFLVVEKDEEVIGYILADKREDQGVIISIAVQPNSRNEGIGTSLMETAQEKMKDVERYFLIVRTSNIGAQLFYEKLGYSKVAKIEDYYSDGEEGLLMQKSNEKKK